MQEVQLLNSQPNLGFALSGEIDSTNAEEFYGEVMNAYRIAPANIQFFCTHLDFIDSTTLGTFVKILKQVKADGFTMRLVDLQPRLKKLFVICALDKEMGIDA